MNAWKELKKDNLPADILTGGYEFQFWNRSTDMWCNDQYADVIEVLDMLKENVKYRYRKKEKPAPTHEDIMSKWWKDHNGIWFRIVFYNPKNGAYITPRGVRLSANYLSKLKSADIPPEAI